MGEARGGIGEIDTGAGRRDLRLVSRLASASSRRSIAAALAAGRLRTVDEVDLLSEESLHDLAPMSLYLLLGSGVVFVALVIAAQQAYHAGQLFDAQSPVLRALALLALNVVAYVVMLPLHEGVHATMILALGGRPRFGLKLPFAAYCTAPGQIFARDGYLAVALAPLIVLTVVGAVATWLWPGLGACIVLGLAGNVSGAVGDLASSVRLLRLPATALVTDTDTGYVAYMPRTE
jgi:putative zincin peptidase